MSDPSNPSSLLNPGNPASPSNILLNQDPNGGGKMGCVGAFILVGAFAGMLSYPVVKSRLDSLREEREIKRQKEIEERELEQWAGKEEKQETEKTKE